jgi:hypothetical protein
MTNKKENKNIKSKSGNNKGKKYEKPISLWPLKPEEALEIFLQVPPKKKQKI